LRDREIWLLDAAMMAQILDDYGPFSVDACAGPDTAQAKKFYTGYQTIRKADVNFTLHSALRSSIRIPEANRVSPSRSSASWLDFSASATCSGRHHLHASMQRHMRLQHE
jgi:hypothetical protein